MLAISLSAAVLVGGASAVGADDPRAVDPPSPITGHAQVVATWLLDLGGAPYWWNVVDYQIDPAGTQLPADDPRFLIGRGDRSVVVTSSDLRVRLADGEAVFQRPGSAAIAVPVGTEAATLTALALSTTAGENGSTQLDPGAGTHDVDILRDTMAPGETFSLHVDIPAFVLVTAGAVTGADGVTTSAGGWTTLVGDIALTNSGTDPAVVVVAIIGPALQVAQPTTTSTPSTTTTAPATTTPPTTTSTTTTTAPATTTTTAPPATAPPATDPPATDPPASEPPPGSDPGGSQP